jgi:hypothetical protein
VGEACGLGLEGRKLEGVGGGEVGPGGAMKLWTAARASEDCSPDQPQLLPQAERLMMAVM